MTLQRDLSPDARPLAPLALRIRRVAGAVVGRSVELAAIQEELAAAQAGRVSAVTVEGEPGIGKTRLLLATSELATTMGFSSVAVAADEEFKGPFLLARSVLASIEPGAASGAGPIRAALDALTGRDDPTLESLPGDRKLLRILDLAAIAVGAVATERPIAILLDDLQWADEDSVRLIRYIVRSNATSPIFLMFAVRPQEMAEMSEGVALIADMERMGLVRRLRLARFGLVETSEFLRHVLGGAVDQPSAATVHGQSEGVPFIMEEVARAYRETGLFQQIDGRWALARNAERLVPSSVRTLIQRRAARLPEQTKALLSIAAILGRDFSLKDVAAVRVQVGEGTEPEIGDLARAMEPAVAAGLLDRQPEGSAADYGFPHEQVREYAADLLPPARRRAIHGAIVGLLMAGEPAAESLSLVASHAKAAGDAQVCVRFSLQAVRNALAAHAPDEVLRVVELALPAAATPQDRLALLSARDEALDMLRRASERLQGLAEIAALAEALGDAHLELDVALRRAAALRLSQEEDAAAGLARDVRARAAERQDREAELAACLELGQDLLRSALGEGFVPAAREVDLDGAQEAYDRAVALAQDLGDESSLAAAERELGIIALGRLRAWFVERIEAGEHLPIMQRVLDGESVEQVLGSLPVAPIAHEAEMRMRSALERFERLGDRQGMMSSIIALAYHSWGPDIHIGSDSARHIEEIRRLSTRMHTLTRESERRSAEIQMLYGVHVFSRSKVIPDLALSRGEEAYRAARVFGDLGLAFLAAGGTALVHAELGEFERAESWLDRAAAAAAEAPTPLRARRLELWRGLAAAAGGDAERMRRHLGTAVRLATEQGHPAARCEVLAAQALEAARLGAERADEDLLSLAERSARDAKDIVPLLPGHPLWGAQADAALGQVTFARGEREAAADAARSALATLQAAMREDPHLEILLPAATVLLEEGQEEERGAALGLVRFFLALIANRTADADVRARWFRGPVGRRLSALAGPIDAGPPVEHDGRVGVDGFDASDARLLRLLAEGKTNAEIAEDLGGSEADVVRRLAATYAKIGATSRAEATAFAFQRVM